MSMMMFALVLLGLCMPFPGVVNPFTQTKAGQLEGAGQTAGPVIKKRPAEFGAQAPGKPGILMKLIFFQQQIREKMTALIHRAKTTEDIMPLIWVLGTALIYGIVHSAGPGHGKALAVSYVFGFKPGIARAVLFGNLLAFTHGMSGVGLVLLVKFVLQASMSSSLASFTQITQIISYSLISLLGIFLFIRQVIAWKARKKKSEEGISPPDRQPSLYTALAVGMIPCPGVVLAMLFCVSMDLTFFGILMGLAISTGMGLTLSGVALVAVLSKSALLKGTGRFKKGAALLESVVEAFAGLLVAGLGLFFLLGVFY
jgi:ABC-type nickel/cobalt efflux system permease component RcnA